MKNIIIEIEKDGITLGLVHGQEGLIEKAKELGYVGKTLEGALDYLDKEGYKAELLFR